MKKPPLPTPGEWVLYRPVGKDTQIRVQVAKANEAWIYLLTDGPGTSPKAFFHSRCATLAGVPFA